MYFESPPAPEKGGQLRLLNIACSAGNGGLVAKLFFYKDFLLNFGFMSLRVYVSLGITCFPRYFVLFVLSVFLLSCFVFVSRVSVLLFCIPLSVVVFVLQFVSLFLFFFLFCFVVFFVAFCLSFVVLVIFVAFFSSSLLFCLFSSAFVYILLLLCFLFLVFSVDLMCVSVVFVFPSC